MAARRPASCSPTCGGRASRCALVTMSYQRFVAPDPGDAARRTRSRWSSPATRSTQGKPHPEPYQKAAALSASPRADTLAIEDSEHRRPLRRGRRLHRPRRPEPRPGAAGRAPGLRRHAGRHEDRRPPRPGRRRRRPMDGGSAVTALRRYPVKACAGEPLEAAEVRVDGFRHDRGARGRRRRRRSSPSASTRCSPGCGRSSTTRPPCLALSYDGRDPVEALVDTYRPHPRGHHVRRDGRRRRPGTRALRPGSATLLGRGRPPGRRHRPPRDVPAREPCPGRRSSPTRAPSPCTPRRRWRGSTTLLAARGDAARCRPTGSARTSSSTDARPHARTTPRPSRGRRRAHGLRAGRRALRGDHRRPAGGRTERSGAAAHAGRLPPPGRRPAWPSGSTPRGPSRHAAARRPVSS